MTSLDATLLRRLSRVEQLPSMPLIVAEALQLLEQSETDAASIARLIERDQALTARLLRVANSPIYSFSRRITTIRLAISLLGNEAIREILLAATLYELLHTGSSVWARELFWQYCLYSACATRIFARRLGYRLAGEAFTAGLLHDLGILLTAAFLPAEFHAIQRHQQHSGCAYVEAEHAVLGTTHAELGAWLAERWNLPSVLIHALAYHHCSGPLPAHEHPPLLAHSVLAQVSQPLTALVALAEVAAHWAGLRQWSGESTLLSPLFLPEVVQHHLLAHSLIESTGKPSPELAEEIDREYNALAQALR